MELPGTNKTPGDAGVKADNLVQSVERDPSVEMTNLRRWFLEAQKTAIGVVDHSVQGPNKDGLGDWFSSTKDWTL